MALIGLVLAGTDKQNTQRQHDALDPICLPEAARRRGWAGGRRPVVDDDKRAAILARRQRGESIRTIAGVEVSVGVVHKALAEGPARGSAGTVTRRSDSGGPVGGGVAGWSGGGEAAEGVGSSGAV
ncbi:hypothetical protein [Streptosporangium sp. NBC_01756]|uniref:hypothetical protein n=1 Tax=Streptosporangium sp. NBC_01756 TaxID=2975950 RepID=UPI002DD84C71|nr:hypothetical protein [Streptosporangium sp. NBC_01756]WSC86342.1 hypothetical protein OIE48_39320 [Streptosporangium sp. NBC_01756]